MVAKYQNRTNSNRDDSLIIIERTFLTQNNAKNDSNDSDNRNNRNNDNDNDNFPLNCTWFSWIDENVFLKMKRNDL